MGKKDECKANNQFRQMSYKPYIIGAVIFGTFGVLAGGTITFSFVSNCEWMKKNVNLLLCVLIGICILGLAFSVLQMIGVKSINKSLRNLDYGMDYDKELECYKNVGKNKEKLKYDAKYCKNYKEWKKTILTSHNDLYNNENFYRFIIDALRRKKLLKEAIFALVLPIEAAFMPVFLTNIDTSSLGIFMSAIILMLFMVIYFTIELINAQDNINFLRDFSEILFPDLKSGKDDF